MSQPPPEPSNERVSYYASLPEYYKMEELRLLIIKQDTPTEDIITFIKVNSIPVNSYIKGIRPNEWIPLIHLCCKTERLQPVVKFLIKSGANLQLLPDADEIEPLLISCDLSYFRFLVEHACRLPANLSSNIIKRKLRSADVKRLKLLVKIGQLTVSTILAADKDPVLYCLTAMKDYLMYAFNIRKDISNLSTELNSVISKFMVCVHQLLEWGATVTNDTVQFCVDYYLYEFATLLPIKIAIMQAGEAPVYHEYKDKLMVAILRPLLNDARYERTCLVMKKVPSKEVYNLKF